MVALAVAWEAFACGGSPQPPRLPRGTPRTPGSGRRRGTPNRKTLALRQLMGALAGDVDYQERLSSAFRRRRLHPSTEMRVWDYVVGKPPERVQVSADVTMNEKLDQERELFARLSIEDLEELARDNEQLLAKARTMAQRQRLPPAEATLTNAPIDGVECTTGESAENTGDDDA